MANIVEVIVELKNRMDAGMGAIQGGLNRLGAALNQRAQEVQRFNKTISNGDVALRQWATALGSLLSVSKLNEFAQKAREAESANNKLRNALARRGESQFFADLKKQSGELKRVTNFSGTDIAGAQTLLLSFGANSQQVLSMMEPVLDFAEQTGNSAEGAAMMLGKLLRGEQVEMGRFKLDLDQSKDRVTALMEAMGKFASGTARAAVADKQRRQVEADWGTATVALGKSWLSLTTLFQGAMLPALQSLTGLFDRLVKLARPFAEVLADLAKRGAIILPVIAAVSLSLRALHAILNPLRVAFVALTGRTFTEFNMGLETMSRRTGGLWSELKNGGGVLQGLASSLAMVGAVAASAFVGWELGKFIGDLQAGGLALKDWVAVSFASWCGLAAAGLAIFDASLEKNAVTFEFWKSVLSNPAQFGTALAVARAKFEAIDAEMSARIARDAAKWQEVVDDIKLPQSSNAGVGEGGAGGGKNNGFDLDGTATAQALELKRQVFALETDIILAKAAGDEAEVARLEKQKESLQLTDEEKELGAEIVAQRRSALEFQALFDRSRKAAAFEDETAALAAQVAGDQREMDRLDRLAREKKYREELAELGRAAEPIVQARIAAEDALTAKERVRTEQDRRYNEQLTELQERRTLTEQNRLITQEEKERRTVDLLTRENQLIAERIALLEREKSLGVSDERRGQIDNELQGLRSQSTSNSGAIAEATPIALDDAPLAGAVDWLDRMQTRVESIREAVYDLADAFAQGVGRSITGLIKGTMTWQQALSNIGTSIVDSIIGSFARMAANWITQQIIMAVFGNAIRAAQLAATAPIALATAAMWAPAATAASIATLGAAAIEGATMAQTAIWASAAGFQSGGYTGDGAVDAIAGPVHRGEYVFDAAATSRLGVDFLDSLRYGTVSSIARPAYATSSAGGGSYGGSGGDTRINIGIVDRESSARRFLDSSEGQRTLIRRNRRAQIYSA